MKELQPVEYSNQRILTTQQIAEAYGTTPQIVTNNFNRNKKHFTEGKHYYCLEGEALKEFLSTNQFDLSTNQVNNRKLNKLYLWTEKGAWLLAKSLNTDEAWQACEMLVDEYYRLVSDQTLPPLAPVEEFKAMLDAMFRADANVLAVIDAKKLIVSVMYLQRLQELFPEKPAKSMELRMLNAMDTICDAQADRQSKKPE